ncbi:hypothetical protein ABL850_15730 [Variovorax paradoxus]|jgi:hypothetical protein|uniref:hypothetical protein n=1 Tax=Variovorax paradoxus TaxID=34073 RepID=UPI0003F97514
MTISTKQLFEVFTPLLLALHEKKVLDIAELPHFYEDALSRRKLDRKETHAETAFLEEVTIGMQRLANVVKQQDRNRPQPASPN